MHPSSSRSRRPFVATLSTLVALAALALAGCSNDNNALVNPGGGGGGSTTYDGTISGPTTSGTLTVTVAISNPAPQPGPARARGTVTATGTLVISGGGTVALTGTHDDAAHVLAIAGGGWTFNGGTTGFGMEGTFSGPGGASGVFSIQRNGTGADTVIVVIGTYAATVGTGSGNFNISIRGTAVHGNAVDFTGGAPIPLDGTYTAGTGAISIVNPGNPSGPPLATGTLTGASATGTWDNSAGDSGTWTGTKQ